jgi:hypothetical protein
MHIPIESQSNDIKSRGKSQGSPGVTCEPGLPGQSDVVDRLTVISGGMEARPGEAGSRG